MNDSIAAFAPHLTWGVVALLLVFMFRREIRGLFSRGSQLKVGKVDLGQRNGDPSNGDPAVLQKAFHSRLLIEQEAQLQKALDELNLPAGDRETLLIRALSNAQHTATCERLYSAIFGSQLDALISANPGAATEETLREHYALYTTEAERLNGSAATAKYEEWLAFPVRQGLMKAAEVGYSTTDFGREFMAYIARSGKGRRLF